MFRALLDSLVKLEDLAHLVTKVLQDNKVTLVNLVNLEAREQLVILDVLVFKERLVCVL